MWYGIAGKKFDDIKLAGWILNILGWVTSSIHVADHNNIFWGGNGGV